MHYLIMISLLIYRLQMLIFHKKQRFIIIFNILTLIFSFESEMKQLRIRVESMAEVYENLQEKMHDVDKTM